MMFIFFFFFLFFFFNDTATTEIYTLSLHDALPIYVAWPPRSGSCANRTWVPRHVDRKSTRLNSSHGYISYAVFCLKKKKTNLIMSEYVNKKKRIIVVSRVRGRR